MSIFERISEFKSAPNDCQLIEVTVDLEDFSNPEIAEKLSKVYSLKDTLQLKVGTFINCVLTHEVKYFMMTRRKLDIAIKDDKNHTRKGLSTNEYGRLLALLKSKGIIEVVEEYSKGNRKAGVYKIVCEGLLELLDKMHNEEYYQKQKENTLSFYSENGGDILEDDNVKETAAERRKEKNRLLAEGKKELARRAKNGKK